MKVLVTGGAGFIGQHVVARLAACGFVEEIVCLDLVPYPVAELDGIKIRSCVGDVRDELLVQRVAVGVSSIIHLAALASVPDSIRDPRRTHEVNLNGTLNVLEACRLQGVTHLILASSSAVYGNHPGVIKNEFMPVQYLSPYAASKGAAEAYALAYGESYGVGVVAFRFFNVFGPGQDASHPYAAVIPRFLDSVRRGVNLEVFGDGMQTRDFVSVHFVAEALAKASVRQITSAMPINIASGESISINHLIEDLNTLHGRALEVTYREARPGDVRHSGADVTYLHKLVSDLSDHDFHCALKEVYNWFIGDV